MEGRCLAGRLLGGRYWKDWRCFSLRGMMVEMKDAGRGLCWRFLGYAKGLGFDIDKMM